VFAGTILNYKQVISHLVPIGSGALAPFLILVELVRTIIRPLTLAFRLAANITAGHVILSLVARTGVGPTIFYTMFESAVCIIQAYVFVLLIIIYANDYFPYRLKKPYSFHECIDFIYGLDLYPVSWFFGGYISIYFYYYISII